MKAPQSGLIPENKLAIATDLYQLTMANGYLAKGKEDEIATFDLFVRKMPKDRSYLVVAGVEQALHYLTNVKFCESDIELLKKKEAFSDAAPEFWDYLRNFKFTGDVWAMPEGTVAFGNEPMMTVTAPIIEAQLAETYLLTCYNHNTKIASKAARVVEAAKGRPILEFGMRRSDIGAATRGARSTYIGGAIGSSNVLAEDLFGIPSYGTHAHSWIMSFDSEDEAFSAYFDVYGEQTVALVDTYDTLEGVLKAAQLPGKIKGVRLDSGDLSYLSKEARKILDAAGKKDGKIFASNDLDEYKIEELLADGAQIDVFGIGTMMILSADNPALGGVYKLAEVEKDGVCYPKLKLSKDKSTLPGKKQIYRRVEDGKFARDIIGLRGELDSDYQPLLVKMIEKGELVYEMPELRDVRAHALENISRLPDQYRQTKADQSYKVEISSALSELTERTKQVYQNGGRD